MQSFVEQFKREISGFTPSHARERTGTVLKVGDGVAEIDGLTGARMSEMIRFDLADNKTLKDAIATEQEVYGVVLNLEEDAVRAIVLGDAGRIREGMTAVSTGEVLSIGAGEGLLGRVVSPLGEALDGLGAVSVEMKNPIEREGFGVMAREGVSTPLHTGIKAIDSMIPIGRGQRELIIGDRYTGKTTIAVDTILNQLNEPHDTRPVCIYVSIGQKESKTARLVSMLKEKGAMEYTVVVDAGASSAAALQYLAPFAGAAIGEYFMLKGKDALIIYDDLSKHAVAYRELSLLLRRPPGREAYPGDVFYLHSRLLERAAKLNAQMGGGSLTALPIIETQEGDISGYIPTNVISITDGQIFLETDLFNKGMRPAVNVGNSVSRVGSAAQTKAMKKVSAKIKLELAQFRELEAFMQFAQDLDPETKKRIEFGNRLTAILRQKNGAPLHFAAQAAVIYAVTNQYLENVDVARVGDYEASLLAFLEQEADGVLSGIAEAKELTSELEEKLKASLARFNETYGAQFEHK